MTSNLLKLSILSPERRLVENVIVSEVTLPTSEGQVQILPGHAPIIGVIETGIFAFHTPNNTPVTGAISVGFFEVRKDEIFVMAENIELKNEINFEQAKLAQKEAERTLQEATLDEHHFKKYQLRLQKAIVRQQIASLRQD